MALTDLTYLSSYLSPALVLFNRFDRFSSNFKVDECRLKTKKLIRWLNHIGKEISASSPVT